MGGCFSGDVRGGMEAVGVGGGGRSHGGPAAAQQQGGPNDAVDHFFQARGLRGLYTPVEVSEARARPVDGHESALRWMGWLGAGVGWLRFWVWVELGFCCCVWWVCLVSNRLGAIGNWNQDSRLKCHRDFFEMY